MELTADERDILRTRHGNSPPSQAIRRRLKAAGFYYCGRGDHIKPLSEFAKNGATCRQCSAEQSKSYREHRGGRQRRKVVRDAAKRAYMDMTPIRDDGSLPDILRDDLHIYVD